jgi:hypothetical protein
MKTNRCTWRGWTLALSLLGIAEAVSAQVATPYLSAHRNHVNPTGAVWRETGNVRVNYLSGDNEKQEFAGSLIGEAAGAEVEFLANETREASDGTTSDRNGTAFRGAFSLSDTFAVGYGMSTFEDDVAGDLTTSGFGLGVKLSDSYYLGYYTEDAKVGDTDYSVAGLGAGGIFGNPSDLQWKFEYAGLQASESEYSRYLTVIEARTGDTFFLVEIDDGESYDRQTLGVSFETADSWTFGIASISEDSSSGFLLTLGYNYKNVNRFGGGGGGGGAAQPEQEPPPEEQQ